jgi:hypothetical protein
MEAVKRYLGGSIKSTRQTAGGMIVSEREESEARAIADTPHLTGDPEFDAIELAETDPSRPPLRFA